MVKKTDDIKKISTREARAVIKKFVSYIDAQGIPYTQVFLFGSCARGSQRVDSDIDVAVVVANRVAREKKSKIRNIVRDASQINWRLEPHFFTEEDFNNKYLSLPPEIKKYGVRVV